MRRIFPIAGAAFLAASFAGQVAIAQEATDEDAVATEQEGIAPGAQGQSTGPGMMGQGMGQGMDPGMGQGMGRGMMGQGMGPGMMGQGMGPGMMGQGMGPGMKSGRMPAGMIVVLFTLLDTDGSESLSLEEVVAPHERMFQRIDEDASGEVSLEEMRGFMQQMHGG